LLLLGDRDLEIRALVRELDCRLWRAADWPVRDESIQIPLFCWNNLGSIHVGHGTFDCKIVKRGEG
jgi:hypothetical protein